MTVNVGINGFGRIGRNILRALLESDRTDLKVVAINDLAPLDMARHLFKNDSVHGRFNGEVKLGSEDNQDFLTIDGQKIRYSSDRDPANLNWTDVDVAFECTGFFTDREGASAHLKNGSKQVLISAPGKNADRTIVYGVNHNELAGSDKIVSNASCTTNCLAPVAYILDKHIGIEKGYMTTIHAYTGDQPILDAAHKDPYRARAAAISMIPTSTGAARAVGDVLPGLKGKLDGSAIRVPTPNVSVVDLSFTAKRATSAEEINQLMQDYASDSLKGVLGMCDEPLVSIDFNHDPHSSTLAASETKVLDGNFVRVLSWYDNEWGFSNRMLDTAVAMQAVSATPAQKSVKAEEDLAPA